MVWNKGKTKADYPQLSRSGVKKGNTPWNKGMKSQYTMPPASEERKAKARLSNLKTWAKPEIRSKLQGKNHPSWGKTYQSGETHWNWKGGISETNKTERHHFRKHMQNIIFQRDNYTCQICDQYSGYLQVDHIKSWKDYPELRFEESNCRTLCMACHYYVTFKRKMPNGTVWGHNLKQRIG